MPTTSFTPSAPPALDDEAVDHPMEGEVVVEAVLRQRHGRDAAIGADSPAARIDQQAVTAQSVGMRDERDGAEVRHVGVSGAIDRRLRRARHRSANVSNAGEGAGNLLMRAGHIGLAILGPVGEARHEHALEERFREGALRAVGGSSHNTG